MESLYGDIWAHHLKRPVDEVGSEESARNTIKSILLSGEWYEAYDLLEFAIASEKTRPRIPLMEGVQQVLAEELAGFRLLGDQFVEVTAESEIEAIDEALGRWPTRRWHCSYSTGPRSISKSSTGW